MPEGVEPEVPDEVEFVFDELHTLRSTVTTISATPNFIMGLKLTLASPKAAGYRHGTRPRAAPDAGV